MGIELVSIDNIGNKYDKMDILNRRGNIEFKE